MIKELLELNPDDQRALAALSRISGSEWIYDLSSPRALEILNLDDPYARVGSHTLFACLPSRVVLPSTKIDFIGNSEVLAEFLLGSINKRDILKPVGFDNVNGLPKREILRIRNATVICTPISICVLDADLKIVREASHNAAEALLLAFKRGSLRLSPNNIEKAILGSIQQAFNLGHWFIDTLPRLSYLVDHHAASSIIELSQYSVLLDTVDHDIIKYSMHEFGFSSFLPTLPFSIYCVSDLVVPLVYSFDDRVKMAAQVASRLYPESRSMSDCQLGHCTGNKIYLSRQKVERRKIINHVALDQILSDFGFSVLHPQELDLFTMSRLISESEIVLAPNGAALANILFGGLSLKKVAILYPPSHIDDYYFRVTRALCYDGVYALASNSYPPLSYTDALKRYYYPSVGEDYLVDPDIFSCALQAIVTSS